jgi:hypothetical protein
VSAQQGCQFSQDALYIKTSCSKPTHSQSCPPRLAVKNIKCLLLFGHLSPPLQIHPGRQAGKRGKPSTVRLASSPHPSFVLAIYMACCLAAIGRSVALSTSNFTVERCDRMIRSRRRRRRRRSGHRCGSDLRRRRRRLRMESVRVVDHHRMECAIRQFLFVYLTTYSHHV